MGEPIIVIHAKSRYHLYPVRFSLDDYHQEMVSQIYNQILRPDHAICESI